MRVIAGNLDKMPRSGIRVIMDLAAQRGEVFHLELGEPGFPTPPHVVEAAAAAAAAGFTKYTANAGLASLRQAVVDKLARENGLTAGLDQVCSSISLVPRTSKSFPAAST